MPYSSLTCEKCGAGFRAFRSPSQAPARYCGTACSSAARERPASVRFEEKVDKSGPCWLWTGALNRGRGGYGVFRMDGAEIQAHRAAWILSRGPIPDGMFVLHRCDNPPCVNPDHLFLGTHEDNMADMVRKGRHGSRRKVA